jgi:hypothetical protein
MTDVATLGLAVDSSQVDKGKIALDQLSNSAKRAQAAAGGVSASTKNAGTAAASLSASAGRAAASLNAEAAAAQKATLAMRAHATAANTNIQAAKNLNTANLAAQFQDIAVSAQMGMGALQIGLQQGTQVAAVLATMERPVQGLAQAFASVLSPVSLLTIGLISLAAAGLQFIDWTKVGAALLRGLADVLESVAPYAIGAAAGLALLYAPAILSGIATVVVGVWGLVRALGAAAVAMAIANPAAAFVLGITAIVAAAVVFRDEITQIFGRDIVGDVKAAANFVINSFTAAFEDLKFLWNNFGDIVGAAVLGGVNASIRAINSLLEKAAEGIDWLIKKANTVLETVGMDPVSEIGKGFQLKEVANPAASRVSAANDAHRANIQGILSRDTIGEFGGAIARGASAASDKLRELAGSLGEVEGKTKKSKSETERLAERYNDILLGAEGFIASQMAEKDALLLTEEAANALRYEQDLLNEAMQAGIKIDAAKAAELKSYAAAMAGAEAETSRLRDALDFAQGVSRGFFEDFAGGLRRGEGLWKSFADAAVNALDKVASKLLDSGLDMLFGGGSTGGYGILSSLLGLGGGGSDPWAGLRGYADGTASARAGVAMVGERGPELVRFRGGEQVVPNHMLGRGANNNQPVAANFTFAPVMQSSGNRATDEQMMADMRKMWIKDFTPMVVKSLGEIKRRGLA